MAYGYFSIAYFFYVWLVEYYLASGDDWYSSCGYPPFFFFFRSLLWLLVIRYGSRVIRPFLKAWFQMLYLYLLKLIKSPELISLLGIIKLLQWSKFGRSPILTASRLTMTQSFELISQYNHQYVVIQMVSFSRVLLNLIHHARPCMEKLLLPFLLLNSTIQYSCLMLFLKVILSQSTLPSNHSRLAYLIYSLGFIFHYPIFN
jgi:hypothetical protein